MPGHRLDVYQTAVYFTKHLLSKCINLWVILVMMMIIIIKVTIKVFFFCGIQYTENSACAINDCRNRNTHYSVTIYKRVLSLYASNYP